MELGSFAGVPQLGSGETSGARVGRAGSCLYLNSFPHGAFHPPERSALLGLAPLVKFLTKKNAAGMYSFLCCWEERSLFNKPFTDAVKSYCTCTFWGFLGCHVTAFKAIFSNHVTHRRKPRPRKVQQRAQGHKAFLLYKGTVLYLRYCYFTMNWFFFFPVKLFG